MLALAGVFQNVFDICRQVGAATIELPYAGRKGTTAMLSGICMEGIADDFGLRAALLRGELP